MSGKELAVVVRGLNGNELATLPMGAGKVLAGVEDSIPVPKTMSDAGHDHGAATGSTTAASTAEVRTGTVRHSAPIAAELVSVKADAAVANGLCTIAAQPDVPRKLQVRITDTNGSISAGTLDIVGIGPSGEAASESVALTGGTATKTTTKAYAKITTMTVVGLIGEAAGDNLSVGVASALGLPGCKTPASSAFAVFKACADGADEAVGTVDATAGTIVPTTAPDAATAFDFWFNYTVTPTQSAHTHTVASDTADLVLT